MASTFPTALDAFTNPQSTDPLDSTSVPHASQHANINDAVEAVQAKVGRTNQSGASRGILFASSTGGFRNSTGLGTLSTGGIARFGNTAGGVSVRHRSAFGTTSASFVTNVDHFFGGRTSTNISHVVRGAASQSTDFRQTQTSTGGIRERFTSAGQLQLSATGVNGGVLIGGDVQWYRASANVMRTPDSGRFDGGLGVGGDPETGGRINCSEYLFVFRGTTSEVAIGSVGGDPGILFGSTQDTNLRRSTSNTLKTDDRFVSANFANFASGDQTPTVGAGNHFKTANAAATTYTDFDDGANGQDLTVIVNDANSVFAHSTNLKLQGSANFTAGSGDVLRFTYDGQDWHQVSRSTR